MSFHDDRLPTDIEPGAVGGPRFKTTVTPLRGGGEQRNIDWEQTKGEWDVGYGMNTVENRWAARDFFHARWGRGHSWKFKDHGDYQIPDGGGSTPQEIDTGDNVETEFQIVKRYTSGGYTFEKTIRKIVAGTYSIYVDGVLQTETTHYTIDVTTGIITFVSPPGNGLSVGVVCEFDYVVRFASDKWDNTMHLPGFSGVPSVPIEEVRVD